MWITTAPPPFLRLHPLDYLLQIHLLSSPVQWLLPNQQGLMKTLESRNLRERKEKSHIHKVCLIRKREDRVRVRYKGKEETDLGTRAKTF